MSSTATDSSIEEFTQRFAFREDRKLFVGVEREGFLTKKSVIVPEAERVLTSLKRKQAGAQFTYELSACQIEGHAGPCHIDALHEHLRITDTVLAEVLGELGLRVLYTEVAPETIPLDVYPDPSGRYARLVEQMPRETLLAACRVAGVHVHIGMPNRDAALRAYNRAVGACRHLIVHGDGSRGERLSLYEVVKPDFIPRTYESWTDFHADAVKRGFGKKPRNNWDLIRISLHGTIEFRMFGTTDNLEVICEHARICHSMCADAIR